MSRKSVLEMMSIYNIAKKMNRLPDKTVLEKKKNTVHFGAVSDRGEPSSFARRQFCSSFET